MRDRKPFPKMCIRDRMECAAKIRKSVDTVLEEGEFNTPDIGGNATTAEYVEEIIKRL